MTIVLSSSITANTVDLQKYLSAKDWPGLKAIFLDNSHEALGKYFAPCQEIKFVTFVQDKLTYKAKFEKYAEVGTILYEKKEGKYFQVIDDVI